MTSATRVVEMKDGEKGLIALAVFIGVFYLSKQETIIWIGGPTRTFENSAALFSRLGCADDAIANFPPALDAGPRRRLRRGPAST